LEADWFRCLEAFGSIWKLTVFANKDYKEERASITPKPNHFFQKALSVCASIQSTLNLEAFGSIWKLTAFAILDCFDIEQTNQRKQSSVKLPNASKTVSLCRNVTSTKLQV